MPTATALCRGGATGMLGARKRGDFAADSFGTQVEGKEKEKALTDNWDTDRKIAAAQMYRIMVKTLLQVEKVPQVLCTYT